MTGELAAGPPIIAELENALADRRAAGLERRRRILHGASGPTVRVDGRTLLAFASNDYLGFAAHPEIAAAVHAGLDRWGVGAGASHLISGHFAVHEALERELAEYVQPCVGAHALLFSTGYLANLAILSALAGREDAIFADRLNHACLNDGALLSRAAFLRYAHADVDALRARLEAASARRRIIATDAVFSMDGDIAPLPELLALADEHDALLVVDDAHGFGVLGEGRGTVARFGLSSARLVVMGTLGKAAGVAGAFVAAHPAIIATLLQSARPYVYTTAAPPALAAGLARSLEMIRAAHERRRHLATLIERLRHGLAGLPWPLLRSATPIQPLMVGDNATSLALAGALWDAGIWVPAIRPPTVPAGTARLRISLSAAHTEADIDALAVALHEAAGRGMAGVPASG